MHIPGFKGLVDHLPDYNKGQIKRLVFRLPGFALLFVIFQILFFKSMAFFYQFFPSQKDLWFLIEPAIPIILQIVFIFFGTLVAQFGFRAKERLLKNDPATAYQKAVKPVLGGISMVFSGLIFSYIPLQNMEPLSPTTIALSTSFLSGELYPIQFYIRLVMGIIFLFIGLRTAYQAVKVFGIDAASLVYVYYPEDAEIVDNEIYSVIRHPMYLSVYLVSFGSFLIYFSPYATVMFAIVALSFYRHIFLIEEKELEVRFGESYVKYAQKVPALFISPKNWNIFFRFLLGIEEDQKKVGDKYEE